MENIKNRTLKTLQNFTTFQKNITNITFRVKSCWQIFIRQSKEKSIEKC